CGIGCESVAFEIERRVIDVYAAAKRGARVCENRRVIDRQRLVKNVDSTAIGGAVPLQLQAVKGHISQICLIKNATAVVRGGIAGHGYVVERQQPIVSIHAPAVGCGVGVNGDVVDRQGSILGVESSACIDGGIGRQHAALKCQRPAIVVDAAP